MQIISRNGPEVLLLNKDNELWLTHRVKRKKDNRRRKIYTKNYSVRHIPIKRIPQNGDWLFTCSMQPQQFDKWNDGDEDDFTTLNGSQHSRKNCSLSLISTEYALFFIKHQLWELYDINDKDFDKYELAVRKICEAYRIKYEGI